MKRTTIIILLTSLLLVSGLIAAGCVQRGSDAQNTNPPGNNGGEGSQNQFRGPGFLSNTTQISEAATKLGVSEDVLREALNITAGGRANLTAAAQHLGVTQQQLNDALGLPSGGFRGRLGNNSTAGMSP